MVQMSTMHYSGTRSGGGCGGGGGGGGVGGWGWVGGKLNTIIYNQMYSVHGTPST